MMMSKAVALLLEVHRYAPGYLALNHVPAELMSLSYAESLAARLLRAGVLAVKRGPGGGYALAVSLESITLQRVRCAIAKPPEQPSNPLERQVHGLERVSAECIEQLLAQQYTNTTLADLWRTALSQGQVTCVPPADAPAKAPPAKANVKAKLALVARKTLAPASVVRRVPNSVFALARGFE